MRVLLLWLFTSVQITTVTYEYSSAFFFIVPLDDANSGTTPVIDKTRPFANSIFDS